MRRTGVPADLIDMGLAPGNVHPYLANYSIGWQAPCGDMHSTANDLATFLKFLLHPTSLLSEKAIREMTHPSTVFPGGLTGFALPWEFIGITPTGTKRSATLVTKNGKLGSYSSVIAFQSESQLGVTVLTSTSESLASEIFELLAVKIMQDLVPAVQSIHAKFTTSLYSGDYKHTAPVVSAHIRNTTLQVLGGSIRVTAVSPHTNLVAHFNVNIVQNGFHAFFTTSLSLMRKPGRDLHAFWSSPGSCFAMSSLLGTGPEIAWPNFPYSVDLYELQFAPEAKFLRWPAGVLLVLMKPNSSFWCFM